MNHPRSSAAASNHNANPARHAAALQRVNRRKVDGKMHDMFQDDDKVRPLPKKRDLVFRICTKLDMLSQVDDVDLYAAAGRELQGADGFANTHAAGHAETYADSEAADAAAARASGAAGWDKDGAGAEAGAAGGGQAVPPDMFSIGSRIAGSMEQIMGALHA